MTEPIPRDAIYRRRIFDAEWVLRYVDVFTRRIVGFGVEPAHIDGISVCRMFNQARRGQPLPKRLSSDHDRYSGFIVGELICEFSTSRKSSLSPSCLALIRSSSGSSEPFGASISTRPSSGTASTSIGSWIDSPPITTSGVSTPDWVDGRPSSDAARLCANRRIYMTSPGNPTVPVSSTRQLLRDQQFAIVRRRSPSSVAHDRCKARHSEKLCTVP